MSHIYTSLFNGEISSKKAKFLLKIPTDTPLPPTELEKAT
jgi:hypothetical protein